MSGKVKLRVFITIEGYADIECTEAEAKVAEAMAYRSVDELPFDVRDWMGVLNSCDDPRFTTVERIVKKSSAGRVPKGRT